MGNLRAVGDDEKDLDPIRSVEDAAGRGTYLDELLQVRLVIARALDNSDTTATALAALSRRHMEVSKEIEAARVLRTEGGGRDSREVSKLDADDEQFDPYSA